MKALFLLLFKAGLLLLYPLGYLVPRRKNLCVFGGGNDTFTDNPKHLFLYASNERKEVDAVWITKKKSIYQDLKNKGLRVEMYESPRGIWTCLRAKYHFYNISLYDVNFYASAGATLVNLWHGTPIKAIGYDVETGPYAKEYPVNWRDKILRPFQYVKPSFFLSSSKFATDKIFKSAFQLASNQYLSWGYPRSDIFFKNRKALANFNQKYEPADIQQFVATLKNFANVFIYLPTFRDANIDFFEQASIDLERLNSAMRKQNSLFVFKMHPKSLIDLSKIASFSNLSVLDKSADIYAFLPLTDCLITDYSSVYFDYLLLKKRLILFPFDMIDYLENNRNLYFDFDEYMIGEKVMDFEELLTVISKKEVPNFPKQAEVKTLFWDDYQGEASEKIMDWVVGS